MGLEKIDSIVEYFEDIRKKLKSEVFGQDMAIDSIVDGFMNSALFGRNNGDRPLGIFLFAGTPGVGKTYLASKLAKYLDIESLSLNMSAYSHHDEGKAGLFGVDGFYTNARQGTIIDFVKKQNGDPCLIILDEFEKACSTVILQFLQILEMGITDDIYTMGLKKLYESNPSKIKERGVDSSILKESDYCKFSNVYFVFTTNAGKSLYENGKQPSPNMTKDAIIDAISNDRNPVTNREYFPEAILSRFRTGTVALFRHLETSDLINIGRKTMEKAANDFEKAYGIKVQLDSNITTLLLLREGGIIDARNFRKVADEFVKNQVINLCATLRREQINVDSVRIGIDAEDLESLNSLIFGEDVKQDIILVCEDEYRRNVFFNGIKNIPNVNIQAAESYETALKMAKKEVFSVPIILTIMPSTLGDVGVTMAATDNAMMYKSMKLFKDFLVDIKKSNEKAYVCVVDIENVTEETCQELYRLGVNDVLRFKSAAEVPKVIGDKIDNIKFDGMVFDFARKGKALKFEVAPAVVGKEAFARLRDFEKINNIKSGDDEFLIGQDRMPNVSFDSVIGSERIKDEAADFISFLKNPKEFTNRGLKAPRGLLLYGPAGTGKTFLAKAIAHEANVPFIATNGGEIKMGGKSKNGAEMLKKYFSIARKYAPSILFIDEMETIALNRTGRDPYADTLVNSLLAEMDGFEGHDSNPVIVIGATNAGIDMEHHVDGRYLDPAAVRRFTRKFFVDVPSKACRLEYLMKNTGIPVEELETAAQMSQGLSFGKMQNAVEIAKRLTARENRDLTRLDVENALETENYGEAKERSASVRERTAYHEAGHACIGCLAGGVHVPDHATVVSRLNFGGYVGTASEETGTHYTKEYFENRIRMSLGGRCAEIIKYGERDGLSYGPIQDFENAFNNIFLMVCKLGMDEEIGVTYYNQESTSRLPEKIQNRIDFLFRKYYDETMKLLLDNRDFLEDIAQNLYTHETLSGKEIKMILEKHNG